VWQYGAEKDSIASENPSCDPYVIYYIIQVERRGRKSYYVFSIGRVKGKVRGLNGRSGIIDGSDILNISQQVRSNKGLKGNTAAVDGRRLCSRGLHKALCPSQWSSITNIDITDMRRLTTGIRSDKCVVRRFLRCVNVYLHKLRIYSLLHIYAIWYSLLLLGYKPVQHVTALNSVGNCNTMVL
jgi:hypothetical protein